MFNLVINSFVLRDNGAGIIRYFRSGWAFLIPYLVVYLLYAWLRWPVVPPANTDTSTGNASCAPALLHVYWLIHALHLLLAGLALRISWGRSMRSIPDLLLKIAPWLGVALIIYLPGVYLEFPADPWHHYARVNEWSWLECVTEHTAWKKSSYFLAYSFIGWLTPPLVQLQGFDVYYTCSCLLLCWQYFRLARTAGIEERASFLFVLLNILIFGNDIFGFYRYYGMSSSMFAQLGAVALTRAALEIAQKKGIRRMETHSGTGPSALLPQPTLLTTSLCALTLSALIAFNHVQGLGIACFGVAAVVVWKLIEWRRWLFGWLVLAAAVMSAAAVWWWPRHRFLDELYRPGGWLTPWYGFNFFSLTSPTSARTLEILGLLGVVNLIAGLWLLVKRNAFVGWLTMMPLLLLSLPAVAIPFANSLATSTSSSGDYIIAFHRMLFAIPSGLALMALPLGRKLVAGPTARKAGSPAQLGNVDAGELHNDDDGQTKNGGGASARRGLLLSFVGTLPTRGFALLLACLVLLAVVAADGKTFLHRFFNAVMVPANDLAMKHVVGSSTIAGLAAQPRLPGLRTLPDPLLLERGAILTTPGISYAMNATGATLISGARKWMTWPTVTAPSLTAAEALEDVQFIEPQQVRLVPFEATKNLFTSGSVTGYISGHWLPLEFALEHAAQDELAAARHLTALPKRAPVIWLEWFSPRDNKHYVATGASDLMVSKLEDRGALADPPDANVFRTGDSLKLRVGLRTLDGDGARLTLLVKAPTISSHYDFWDRANPLGGDKRQYGEAQIRLAEPGRYTLEVTGQLLWPERTFTARYYFIVRAN